MDDEGLIGDPLEPEPKEIELTPQQEQRMLDFWNKDPNSPPGLKELIQYVFDDDSLDGRSNEGKAVKKALAKRSLKAKAAQDYTPREIELSEAHKLYITNNAKTMTAVEMARIIFSNPILANLSAETRAVNEYMKTLDSKIIGNPNDVKDVPTDLYKPPKTLEQVIKRVSGYVSYPEKDELNGGQKKCMMMLIGYLHTFRFLQQMNTYETETDRKLCEDSFIRGTYDKPDLMQEEIDQYIELANQVALAFKIQRRSEKLQSALEQLSNKDADEIKISMSLTEAIGKASSEYHQCIDRQNKLLGNLTQKRSARLDKQLRNNASILNLVQAWKEEESRMELLKHADLEQQAIDKEVDRLSSLPAIKARILGLPKDEARYG